METHCEHAFSLLAGMHIMVASLNLTQCIPIITIMLIGIRITPLDALKKMCFIGMCNFWIIL